MWCDIKHKMPCDNASNVCEQKKTKPNKIDLKTVNVKMKSWRCHLGEEITQGTKLTRHNFSNVAVFGKKINFMLFNSRRFRLWLTEFSRREKWRNTHHPLWLSRYFLLAGLLLSVFCFWPFTGIRATPVSCFVAAMVALLPKKKTDTQTTWMSTQVVSCL